VAIDGGGNYNGSVHLFVWKAEEY